MSSDAFELLFRKLRAQAASKEAEDRSHTRSPYLILIQHSTGARVRQQAVSGKTETEESTYRRAGLRTPAENAFRDLQGGALWTKHIAQLMCQDTDSVIWLRTSARQLPRWLDNVPNLQVIDAAKDPFGWNNDAETKSLVNMEDLNSILHAVESHIENMPKTSDGTPSRCGLVIESLSPIVQRHGIPQTLRLVNRLRALHAPILIPIPVESLSSSDHRQLEVLAEAVLSVKGGDAILLRKGVRERENVVRENLAFDIVTVPGGQSNIRLLAAATGEPTKPATATRTEARSHTLEGNAHGGTKSRSKVELRLEEDKEKDRTEPINVDTQLPDTSTPRIFMEDNDPEFDDYDEEDPDDDLDI